MSTKLDSAALDAYAQQYAARLCDEFYRQQDAIRGEQLLTLSEVEQVNRFVVRDLYERWQADALAFRSPYFDFENEDVKAALHTLMNTASQHIAVRREAFEPLLAGATRQTLTLLLAPETFFEDWLRDRPNFSLTVPDLKLLLKYTRLHRAIPTGWQERLGERDAVYVNEALGWLQEQSADVSTFDDPEPVIARFAERVPLDAESLYLTSTPEPTPAASSSKSFFDFDDEPVPAKASTPAPPSPPPAVPEPAPALVPEVAPAVTMPEPEYVETGAGGPAESPMPKPTSLYEQFQVERTTLNDAMATDAAPPTLADQFHRKATESIHATISLNQKFIFINQLFGGDPMAYHRAITDLEACPTFEEAKTLMNRTYGPEYQWRDNPDVADEFFDIVRRRFGA
jgi:hypothetical protein